MRVCNIQASQSGHNIPDRTRTVGQLMEDSEQEEGGGAVGAACWEAFHAGSDFERSQEVKTEKIALR